MILLGGETIDVSKRIFIPATTEYVHIQFLSFATQGVFEGYRITSPIYIQPVLLFNSVPVAYGKTYSVNKNPSLIKLDVYPLPLYALDISGKLPCILTFYETP